MRVLHVITSINRGGAENHLVELVRGQIQAGLCVGVAFLKGDAYWGQTFSEMGVEVLDLRLKRYGDLSPILKLHRLILSSDPAIVHAHMPPAELYTRLALLLPGCSQRAFLVTKHNDEPFFRGPFSRLISRLVVHRASRIIAISQAVHLYAKAYLKLKAERVITVHYGINGVPYRSVPADVVASLRSSWGIPPDALVIGTVARLAPQKALHVLLTGYAKYRETATRVSRLVIVGRGPLEQELRELAKTLGVAGQVIWAGFREDIPVVMNALDCFAMTSIYEGFGLVLLEAMAASRPVVATAASAIPEIVQHNTTGLLCPINDTAALSAAFIAMEHVELRERYGLAGFERVAGSFAIDEMVSKTTAIYRDVLHGG